MENFSENDNFNKLFAIKTVTGEKYSKSKTLMHFKALKQNF